MSDQLHALVSLLSRADNPPPPVSIAQEAGRAPEQVCMLRRRENAFTTVEIEWPQNLQPAAVAMSELSRHCTPHYPYICIF